MQGWQPPYLGLRGLPREIGGFELQAFFTFDRAEREHLARRRTDNLKLGLALHIGVVRMSGRPLNSVRGLYAPGRASFDHQQQICKALGFTWTTGTSATRRCGFCKMKSPRRRPRTTAPACTSLAVGASTLFPAVEALEVGAEVVLARDLAQGEGSPNG